MMDALFTMLTHAVEGGTVLALLAATVWGVLSIVLSPCHLAGIPLIVGFVNGQGRVTTGRAFALSSLFAGGILVTIAVIGLVTAGVGRLLGDLGSWANYGVAIVFVVVGLQLLEVLRLPWSGPGAMGMQRKGLWAALLLGLVFGLGLGPCTFAYMAPMLAVSLKAAAERPFFSTSLLFLYGVGHCAVVVAAGTFTEIVPRYLKWNERSRAGTILRGACGVLVIAGGIYLVYRAS
ncbi:MAG: cytochrome c biogenesis CcdA family protein [Phycisphaerae bacterium]